MANKEMKVAAYCRVSTDRQDDSLPNQEKYFTEYIKKQEGWGFVQVYCDTYTGTNTYKREGFNRMIQDAYDGKIDLILTKEVSRFARNTLDSIGYTRELVRRGVHIVFTLDNVDTRQPDHEFKLTIFASIAQEESRKTSERVKWGHKREMERGVVFGRREMWGYRVVDKTKMEIVEEEAEVVRDIFRMYLDEGKGSNTITRELTERGIKPFNINKKRKESLWSNTAILRILRNEKYIGDLVQKKTYTESYLDHKKKNNKDYEPKIVVKDHHPAIIDRLTWEAVQSEISKRTPTNNMKSKHSNRYWCSGIIECGACGRKFVSRTKKLKSREVYKAWRCSENASNGENKTNIQGMSIGCDNETVNEKVLTSCIQYLLKYLDFNKEEIKNEIIEEIKSLKTIKDTTKMKSSIEDIIADINSQKVELIKLKVNKEITHQEFELVRDDYDKELKKYLLKLDDIHNTDKIQESQSNKISGYLEEINKMLCFNINDKCEEIYQQVIKKITVYGGRKLKVKLQCLPKAIQLSYDTKGRMDNYEVIFNNIEIGE